MFRHLTVFIGISLLTTGCFDLYQRTYWSEGNYFIMSDPGGMEGKELYYDLGGGSGHGRVGHVAKIGTNDRYIIIESHGTVSNGRTTEYWILDKDKDNPALNGDEIVEGPFTKSEFELRKTELSIEDLEFEKEIK